MLFLHPFGRHALNRDQRQQATLVGLCLGLGLAFLGISLSSSSGGDYLLAALVFGLMALPVSGVFLCDRGWPRWTMAAIAAGLAGLGLFAAAVGCCLHPPRNSVVDQLGLGALSSFFLGIFISQWVANWLATQRPRR